MTPSLGLYGKLPSVGDFVGRGFSHELRDALDGLLQVALSGAVSSVASAQELLTDARAFTLCVRPGALCRAGFLGGVVPSHDRVGRVFPLCIGQELPPEAARLPLQWPALRLAQVLVGQVIRAQASGVTVDQLYAALPDAQQWHDLTSAEVPFSSAEDMTVPRGSVDQAPVCFQGPELEMSPSDRALCSRLPWSAQILGAMLDPAGAFDRFFALPTVTNTAALAAAFDGRWTQWGWTLHDRPAPSTSGRTADEDADATRPDLPRFDPAVGGAAPATAVEPGRQADETAALPAGDSSS